MKYTQHGICSQAAFKNARAMFSSKLCGAGSCFWSGSKKFRARENIPREGCPHPDLTSLEVRGRGSGDVKVIALIALFLGEQNLYEIFIFKYQITIWNLFLNPSNPRLPNAI